MCWMVLFAMEPDDAVSGESLFLFLAFFYQIYYITAMLVIIFAYIKKCFRFIFRVLCENLT